MNQTLRESAALPLLVFVLMFACAAGRALGPRGVAAAGDTSARRGQQEKIEPTTEVYGRAVYEGTGRPVRRARVMLMEVEGGGSNYEVLTDGQGEFRVRGVAPGRYVAVVDLPGLVSPLTFVGAEEARGGQPFDIGVVAKHFDVVEVDGKAPRELKVTARRGAALGGKVTYADGSPAVGAHIHVLRRAGGRLERVLTGVGRPSAAGGRTDDRGVFRAAGLPPGEYLVAASEPAAHGESGSSLVGDPDAELLSASGVSGMPFLTTFHPSASATDDATAVTLGAGEEHEDVNIVIAERELRELSGVVRARRDGRPVAGARVGIYRKGEGGGADGEYTSYGTTQPNMTKTDEQGRWRLKDIPDGPYTIHVKPAGEYESAAVGEGGAVGAEDRNSNMSYTRPRRPKKVYAPAQRDVRVSAVTGELNFELSEGGRISGVIAAEGGTHPGSGSFVYVVRESGGGERDYNHSQISGGQFSFEGLPAGEYSLHYQSYSYSQEGARSYVKAITWEGKDLLRERLTVGEGASVEGVRVVVSSDVATLSARVKGGGGAARGAHVFLMSVGRGGWSQHAQQYHCQTDKDGVCNIGAAPGEYAVIVMPRTVVSLEAWMAEMKRQEPAAPRAVLRAGETKPLELAMPAPR